MQDMLLSREHSIMVVTERILREKGLTHREGYRTLQSYVVDYRVKELIRDIEEGMSKLERFRG